MSNAYNPLRFGVFLTPNADAIPQLRAQVTAAESSGFDYVSIQDHPYAADLLDTIPLLGTLLGETERITVMPNVANLPLRPPAMLAKATSTLDLLSGGRFELGLGGGRNWPQIVGLGGPAWSPREVIAAVDEAIGILGALWTQSRTVRKDGEIFHIHAQPGPAPAHRIGIWLGAIGPRMLDLLGRRADGWIAPLANGFEAKPAAQDRIDRAAVAAGRQPTDVRRVIQLDGSVTSRPQTTQRPRSGPNGRPIFTTPAMWARMIEEFVGEQRFDTVNIVPYPDSVEQVSLFGSEVIPAARAAVADWSS